MYDITDIARYFIGKDKYYTNKKIQKLVYYVYCWYIVKNNSNKDNITKKIFEERPEAWVHGPVFYSLYNTMTYRKSDFNNNYNYKQLDDDIKHFLDIIYNVYGRYTGLQLEELTHNEDPWIYARRNLSVDEKSHEKIDDKIIYEYYSK